MPGKKSQPFFSDAKRNFLLGANLKLDGFLSAIATMDIYYLAHRQTHRDEKT